MIDAGAIVSAIGQLKAASDIAKGFLDLKEAAAVQGKVIELQGVILAAQSSALAAQSDHMAMLEQIRGLKEQMAQLEAWDHEKDKYKLEGLNRAGLAYVLKPDEREGKPPHALCTQCFESKFKSILQSNGAMRTDEHRWKCPKCKAEVAAYRSAMDKLFGVEGN